MKKVLFSLIALFTSFLFVFLLLEIALRLFAPLYAPAVQREHEDVTLMEYNEKYGWFNKKGIATWFESQEYSAKASLNRNGLRGKEYAYEKPAGCKRIIALGNSFAFGLGVGDEDIFSLKLEDMFRDAGRRVEVINMGVNGFGVDQEYILLKEEGFKYSPDIVLVLFYIGNDIEKNISQIQYGKPKPYFTFENNILELKNYPVPKITGRPASAVANAGPRGRIKIPFIKGFLQRHSYAYTFLRLRYNSILFKLGVRASAYPAIVEKGWGVTCAILNSMKEDCEKHGSKFCVVVIPTMEQIRGLESDGLQRKFITYADKNSINYINLLGQLKGRRDLNFIIDSHWNKKGHEFIAGLLFKELEKFMD